MRILQAKQRITSRGLTAGIVPALFLMCCTAAGAQQAEPDLELGGRLVEARCVTCHGTGALAEMVERCVRLHGESHLREFLANHHAPEEDVRANIIAYLTCPDAPD